MGWVWCFFALIFLFQPKGGKSKATEHRSVSPCLIIKHILTKSYLMINRWLLIKGGFMLNIIKTLKSENKNVMMIFLHVFLIILFSVIIVLSVFGTDVLMLVELVSATYVGVSLVTLPIFTTYVFS